MPLDPRIIALSQKHAAELTALIVDIARENIAGQTTVRRTARPAQPTQRKRGRPLEAHSDAGRIRTHLERFSWSTVADIKAATGIEHGYVNSTLQRLIKAGHVQRRGAQRRGQYALALRAVKAA